MKISVCFSFYNEEDVLDELIRRLRKVFEDALKNKFEYELIFVNDASTDKSLQILETHAAQDKRIKIANTSRNYGVSQCMMAAMSLSEGQLIIMMDTDLQDPPEVIPEMIQKWEETQADVIYTVRTKREGEPHLKMFVTNVGYRILRFFSSIDQPFNSGDFKLLTRRVVNEVLKLDEMDPFLRGLVRWVGFKQIPIYYRREGRHAGESHYPFYKSKVLKNFLSGITSFSDTPLYITFSMGLIVSSGSFLYLMIIIFMKTLGWNIPGWSAIMATMLFLGGVQILAVGILGLYIGKIHMEVKNRPNFIIESKINFL